MSDNLSTPAIDQVTDEEFFEAIRLDASLVNFVTQMGTAGDRSEYTIVGRSQRFSKEQLEELYRIPICRRVVRARADSAVLKGWNLTLGGDSDQKLIPKFIKYHNTLKVKEKFHEAQIQANIYGGAVIVVVANDGKNTSDPLDEAKIKTISSLEVLDRNKIQPVLNFGINPAEPELYRLLLPESIRRKFAELFPQQDKDFLIHSSRIIRFDGISYPPDMLSNNEGWGGSVLETLWEDYRDWRTGLKALGAMIQDASVFVYKLKGLAQMVKTQDENLLQSRLKLMRLMISVFGGFAADADGENVEFPSRTFAGVDQVTNQLRDSFIGATGIPHDRLFGESPSGLGATGESEEKNWAADVASFQQTQWLPKLLIIGRYIFLAKDGPTSGKDPEDWGFEFPSLLQQSEADIASNRSTQASTDNTYLAAGVLLPEEVRASRFGGSKYSTETVLNEKLFSKKQKEAQEQQQQQFGDFGGQEELPPEEEPSTEEATNQDSIDRYDALYSQLPKDEEGKVKYLGKWWHPNKPVRSTKQGKKRMVLAKVGDRIKLVHYGAEGYQHNYSPEAKKNYLTRSAGIKDKDGNLTKDDPFSPNYWARRDLWNKKLPADGSTTHQIDHPAKGKKCGESFIPRNKECRKDAADPAKEIVNWNGLSIGITHKIGDTRFLLSRPMVANYGHLRRSYGSAPDGKAIDVYLGENLESPQVFKVRQLDPATGMPDEDKYFIGFEDAASAKDCFTYHAGRDRFGGIEAVDQNELQVYRQDNCAIDQPRLGNGVKIFPERLLNGPPTNGDILEIVNSTFPEEVLGLGDWKYKGDGTVDGEFYTPIGVYGFGIKNNYCGYSWKRELRVDSTQNAPFGYIWVKNDSDPVRPGYTWVNDRTVQGGGYFRKGEAKKPEAVVEHKIKVKSQQEFDESGPGLAIADNLLEADSEREAQVRGALINVMAQSVDTALNSIKHVHSLEGLPDFDIELQLDKQRPGDYGGTVVQGRTDSAGNKSFAFGGFNLNIAALEASLVRGTNMNDAKSLIRLTTIHEMGHTLDLIALGSSSNGFATTDMNLDGSTIPNTPDPQLVSLVAALDNSQGIARIKQARDSATNPQVKAYGNYLLSPNETFARAYSQYIALKSDDANLQQYINEYGIAVTKGGGKFGNGHWDEEEFRSTIMPEFDRVFREKGWLK